MRHKEADGEAEENIGCRQIDGIDRRDKRKNGSESKREVTKNTGILNKER